MKKTLVALMLALSMTTATAGCNTAWWQAFQANPVAQVQAFEQSVQVVLGIAETAWATLSALLPANILAQARPAYNKAVLGVNAALNALNDAVQVAVNVMSATPDFSTLTQAVSDAVAQVTTIINQFQSSVVPPPAPAVAPGPMGLSELNAAVATMHRIGGVK